MIPMSFLLLAWLILLGIFVIFAILTIGVHLRFGISNTFTAISAGVFLAVSILVILGTGIYFLQVDWSRDLGIVNINTFGTQRSVSEFEL